MTQSSSPNKSSIQSSDEYNRLYDMHINAMDRINSGGTGMGYSGIHYEIMFEIRRYGRTANSREEAVRILGELLREYEGQTPQSDQEYVDKFDLD